MALSTTKKGIKSVSKSIPKVVKTVLPLPVSKKSVHNVGLQSWPIPIGQGKNAVWLSPGATIEIPTSAVTDRLINLHKRRLINIR